MLKSDLVSQYSGMLYKICFFILWDKQDAEDAVQETFYRYCKCKKVYNDNEHEKAWLIRVATNVCHEVKRFRFKHQTVALEEISNDEDMSKVYEIADAIIKLPKKLKIVIYLYYIAGYSQVEISDILHISNAAVNKRVTRGRDKLKHVLLDDITEGGRK
jgi:RNA polymerase sigma-70 factor (ECF subfamily)